MEQKKPVTQPYSAPLTQYLIMGIEMRFCASTYSATSENYEDYETEYTLE